MDWLSELVISDVSNLVTAAVCLFVGYLHIRRARRSDYRRMSRYVRAFNWIVFASVFLFIALVDISSSNQRVLLRTAFWLLLAAEAGYNIFYWNNGPLV